MRGDRTLNGLREYHSLSDIRGIVAGRLDRPRQPHLFDRFDWLDMLHRHCMPDSQPRIVCAHRHDDAADAVEAWLFLADTGGRRHAALANWYSFAFRPIFVGNPDGTARLRLVETIARGLARRAARVELYPVLADDGTRDLLLSAFRKAGWLAVARPMGINHYLDLNGRDFATYWGGRPGNLRGTVKRKTRGAPFRDRKSNV